MTSNLGAEHLVAMSDDDDMELINAKVMDVVRGHFRPEFLNRIDDVIQCFGETSEPSSIGYWGFLVPLISSLKSQGSSNGFFLKP